MKYASVVDDIFCQFKGRRFSIRLWDGTERVYGTSGESEFTLVLKDAETLKRLLAQGALGFGEAYMEGRLEVEGNLDAYLRLRHEFKPSTFSLRLTISALLARATLMQSRQSQVSYHYDLGNDFFKLFLDAGTMSYSAGRFVDANTSLEEAATEKFKLVATWLNLKSVSSVLDLGSGWGGFAEYAAGERGAKVVGYTLSKKQLQFSRNLIHEKHLDSLVTFEEKDMLGALSKARVDSVVMLESIEHVGKQYLSHLFRSASDALRPGGRMYVQATGRYKPYKVDQFILKHVFPGGYLPTKDELVEHAQAAGLELAEFRDDTPDYIRTMSAWIEGIESHQGDIERMYSPEFYRLWKLWTHGARVAFEVESMNLFRMLFQKAK